ncbi:MAG: hypothetical protein O2910_07310, partial [Proteobacteria bacterium]|nr:hypothetical protein [Pseudomonadota bacterium]
LDEGTVFFVASSGNIADSILSAVDTLDNPLPLFITTGDNALHTPDIIHDFADGFLGGTADVAVAFTERKTVLKDFPEPNLAFHERRGLVGV